MNVLEVEDLHISFQKDKENINVLKGVSFRIEEGKTVALVGESGCGKSQTARSIMKLLANNAIIQQGSIRFKGEDILRMQDKQLQQIRGKQIAMIFQNPQAVLDPVFTIGKQMEECIQLKEKVNKQECKDMVKEVLELVQIGDVKRILRSYPFQLSLGMCQRIMIAMAIASNAKLWIVDEATSALDGNVQADILDLLKRLKEERHLSMLLISHDLRILPSMSDEILVMLEGELIEKMDSEQLIEKDVLHHPYTNCLLSALSFEENDSAHEESMKISKTGCAYATRCPKVKPICFKSKPLVKQVSSKQWIHCHCI